MVPSVHLRFETHPASDVEGSDPFGAVNLVAGTGEKVDPEGLHVNGNLPEGLDGVGVEKEVGLARLPPLPHQLPDLSDRLDRPNLVVGVHD